MGKAALILVAAVTITSGAAYLNQDRAALDTAAQEALYEHQVLAREIAQSGFNRIESRVRRDFNNHRVQLGDMDHPRGRLDISAQGGASGPVSISATGYFENAEYTITGNLSKSGTRVLDALTIDAVASQISFSSNALVSGMDTNPDGSSGANMDVHAVLTTENDTYVQLAAEVPNGRAPGMSGLLDIIDDSPEINLSQLVANIQSYSGSARIDYSGDTNLDDVTIGSWQDPKVVVVDGDVELSGSTAGYGVLYATGGMIFEDDSRWEGLVVVENNGGDHTFRDQARVYGAVIIRSVWEAEFQDGDDAGLPGGHFDVDVFDEFGAGDYRYHQHKYDDEFDATGVNLMDPNWCGSGGLCWDSILGDEDAVYVEFMNPEMGYGTYDIVAGDGAVTDECQAGGSDDDDDGGSDDDDDGGSDDDDDGGSDDDDDDGGSDDDDDDGGCWWCWWSSNETVAPDWLTDHEFVAGGMPDDVRVAGFSGISWISAMSNRLLSLFPAYQGKVDVCHIPPGNPSNAHTINISENAVPAHLAHGDYLGECTGSSDDDDDGWWDDDDDGGSDDDDDGGWWDDDDDGGSDDDDDDGGSDDDDDGGSDEESGGDGGSDCEDTSVAIPSVDLHGNSHEGLSPTLVDAREVSTFQVNFEHLCALQISSPNGVIYAPNDRNSAFTIRIYKAELDGTTWSQGDLAYELSVYHHTGYGWNSNPGGEICDPSAGSEGMLAGDEVEIDFGDSAMIQYSSRALYRVRNLMAQVDPGEGQVSLQDVREEGTRPTTLDSDH